jgi:hypothetical protein
MQHHTACCVPYPVGRLYNGKIKCNTNTKADGTVHIVAAGACNFSSGPGNKRVWKEARAGVAPTGSARSRGLPDDWGGNAFYFNDESDHWGQGQPLPSAHYNARIISWGVICVELGMSPNSIIAHGEHTQRKIDPRWNGKLLHANMVQMRADVRAWIGGSPLPPPVPGGLDMYQPVKFGDESPAVLEWQEVLVFALGQDITYPGGPPNGLDSDYGGKVRDAVIAVAGGDGMKIDAAVGAKLLGAAGGGGSVKLETKTVEVISEVEVV